MDQEQAERFLAAAQKDYEHAVFWYCTMIEAKADGPETMMQPRAAVLAAQQVLELARTEMHRAEVAFYDEVGTAAGRIRRKAPAP